MEIEAKNISNDYDKNICKTKLKTFLLNVKEQESVNKAKLFVEKELKTGQGVFL